MTVDGVKSVQATSYQTPKMSTNEVAAVETKDVEAVDVTVAKQAESNAMESSGADYMSDKEPSDATIKQAIKAINKKMNSTVAEFGYHEGTKRVTIKIKDKDTDKVVKEIPAEKTLDMIEKAWELAGILVDEKR